MAYDNICKYLAELYPQNFVRWLLSSQVSDIQVLKTELSLEPIRADSMTLLQTSNHILHLEFQTIPESEPPLPLRMLDYWVRLYRQLDCGRFPPTTLPCQYRCSIEQVMIFLKYTSSASAYIDRFEVATTQHQYRVIRLWEEDPTSLLADPALLPLASLARSNSPQALLQQVAARVANIESTDERRTIVANTPILAGLRFDKKLIRSLFREDIMKESVIYQEILQEGLQQGLQQGEAALIIRLLTYKFGLLEPATQQQIQNLPSNRLEELGEALLSFVTVDELVQWLQRLSNGNG